MGSLFIWKDFDNFIKNASLPNQYKHEILCLFAKYLYTVTSKKNIYYRFINAIVNVLNTSITGNTFYGVWQNFDAEVTKDEKFIKAVAEKLLVLANKNKYFNTEQDALDALDNSKKDHINTIDDTITVPYKTNADSINDLDSIPAAKKHKKDLFYDWGGFDTLIQKIGNNDIKLYVIQYFITQLTSVDTDPYLRIKKLLEKNESKLDAEQKKFYKEAEKTGSKLLTTNNEKLLFLCQHIDLLNDISNVDIFECLITENPSSGYTLATTFNVNDLPKSWDDYLLINIVNYDINNLGSSSTNVNNVTDFMNDVIKANSPYDTFKPNVITFQNVNDLVNNKTKYTSVVDTATKAGYSIHTNSDNTLLTCIVNDFFPDSPDDIYSDYVDPSSRNARFTSFVSNKYDIVIINIVNTSKTPLSFTQIKSNCIDPIKRKYILISIGGAFNIGDSTGEFKTYDKSNCIYNGSKNVVPDVYIISKNFDDIEQYDYHTTGTKFDKDYVNSKPVGKSLFFKVEKGDISKVKGYKPPVKVTFKNMYSVLSSSISSASAAELQLLLNDISPPGQKKTATPPKAPSATTHTPKTPSKGSSPPTSKMTTNAANFIKNIFNLDFTKIKDKANKPVAFKKDDYKKPMPSDYVVVGSKIGGKDVAVHFSVVIDGNKKMIENLYKNEKDKSEKEYYIKVANPKNPSEIYNIPLTIDDKDKAKNFKININKENCIVPHEHKANLFAITSLDLNKASTDTPKLDWKLLTKGLDPKYEAQKDKSGKPITKQVIVDGSGGKENAKLLYNKSDMTYGLEFTHKGVNYYIGKIMIDNNKFLLSNPPAPDFDLSKYIK